MQLGDVQFEANQVPVRKLKRVTKARFAKHDILESQPAYEFVGRESDEVTLGGSMFPEFERPAEVGLGQLRLMVEEGQDHLLVDGTGEVWGVFVILNLDEQTEGFFPRANGRAAQVNFSINLRRQRDA